MRGRNTIDKASVTEAARRWFEQDKLVNLDDRLRAVLYCVADEVIGRGSSRAFLVSKELERHPAIQQLHDERVLHTIQRGYAARESPSAKYTIFTLDFGTYVDFIGSKTGPDINMATSEEAPDNVVFPFNDLRHGMKNEAFYFDRLSMDR